MTVTISAEFTTGDVDFNLTLTETSGGTPVGGGTIANTTQRLSHVSITPLMGVAYGSEWLATWLQDQLNATSTASRTYTVTWNTATLRYTIAGSGTFQLVFNTDATRSVLGFPFGNTLDLASHTGTLQPTYIIVAAMAGKSFVSDDYESGVVASVAHSDDGGGYGVQVGSAAKFYDFSLVDEPKAKVFTRAAAAGTWTYQQFWEHCRVGRVFVVEDTLSGESSVHRFTAEGAAWSTQTRERFLSADYDDSWRLNFKTRLVGRL